MTAVSRNGPSPSTAALQLVMLGNLAAAGIPAASAFSDRRVPLQLFLAGAGSRSSPSHSL